MATYDHTKYTMAAATFAYVIGFDYAQTADVKVYINDVLKTATTDYTFTSAGTEITIDASVGHINGDILEIKRVTDVSDLLVTFTAGSGLVAADINTALLQLLYSVDELQVPAYDSDWLTVDAIVTGAADITYPHNLGAAPTRWMVQLKNTTTELGFAVDDIIDVSSAWPHPPVRVNATNIIANWDVFDKMQVLALTTETATLIDQTKWSYRILAWR